ncbi:MAG: VOC family protein [Candidatus Dormibacteraceae bacterium]
MSKQRVIPLLVYRDIEAIQSFLVEAFGFERGILERDRNGRVVHGEVALDDCRIWLHRVTAEHGLTSPGRLETQHGGVVVLVDDVDAHCDRARRAGAVIDSDPTDEPYGQREYATRDPEGGRWYFATRGMAGA